MDILTQGLLGGVLAQSVAQKREAKHALLSGIFAGLLADADVLIRSASDPLLNIEYHRHFTHSLIFIPAGAAIACILLWPFLRKRLAVSRLYLYCLAGYSLSGLLDACTSYGTHLFWPFSHERVALNIISIVDPVFTITLLTFLVLAYRFARRQLAITGLCLCLAYLLSGKIQLERATSVSEGLIAARGHHEVEHIVKPTLGNLLLWRSVYMTDEDIYVDAIRVGLFSEARIYEGESVARFRFTDLNRDVAPSSVLSGDIERFRRFSEGMIALAPAQDNVIGDVRYSMSPVSVAPLWGIRIDPTQPETHADYEFFRQSDKASRKLFINMLLGR